MFTGPSEPGPALTTARISSSVAKVSGLATCGSFSAFNFVQLVITAHQQRNQREAAAFNRFNQQSLNRFLNRQIELFNQFRDGFSRSAYQPASFPG
ncbi:Uncharacterised protein [Escherichia coli]|nr:Uncharacterised protein [Escherichia coli]